MEAEKDSGNGEEIATEDRYGELNLLLNVITANDSTANTSKTLNDSLEFTGIETDEKESASDKVEKVLIDKKEEKESEDFESEEFDDELINLVESAEKEDANRSSQLDLIEDDLANESSIQEPCDENKKSEQLEKDDESLETVIAQTSDSQPLESQSDDKLEQSTLEIPESKEPEKIIESNDTITGHENQNVTVKIMDVENRQDENSSAANVPNTPLKDATVDDSPEVLISMLKKLSPEKLKEIKSQIFTNTKELAASKDEEKMDVDESSREDLTAKASAPDVLPETGKQPAKSTQEDYVILLDSDDDEPPAPKISSPKLPSTNEKESAAKASQNKDKTDPQKAQKKLKECVNANCPRECEVFEESPQFILNFYYVAKKPNKLQYVCASCSDKAILKIEELTNAMMNNEPMCKIELHKKLDMVEVIDSDDEDEIQVPKVEVPELEKIQWNKEIEAQAEDILQSICNKIDLRQQIKWISEDNEQKVHKIEVNHREIDKELKILEQKSAHMYNELYSINKPKIRHRPSLDITDEVVMKQASPSEVQSSPKTLAKPAPIKKFVAATSPQKPQQIVLKRPYPSVAEAIEARRNAPHPTPKFIISPTPPQMLITSQNASNQLAQSSTPQIPRDHICYAIRSCIAGRMQNWAPCRLLETVKGTEGQKLYRVQFFDNLPNSIMVVKGKDFALSAINSKLQIGARVIAQFPRTHAKNKEGNKKYLPGVVGEKLSKYNSQRYLVFCDYGQVQYAAPEGVREIAESSTNVWEDVHENLRQFIIDYLQSQTQRQRALLNVRKGQRVPTERNGAWRNATVAEIDCSVVKMFFSEENTFEWLYRGSKRLGPLYTQGQRGLNTSARRNDPNLIYITIDDDYEQQAAEVEPENKKNTARKSTAPNPQKVQQQQQQQITAVVPATAPVGPVNATQLKVVILNDQQIYLEEPKKVTKHRHFTPRKDIAARRYVAHNCNPSCLQRQNSNLASYSPLTKPLLTCWERQIVRQKGNKWIQYKAPCGRRLRNMYEIRMYLLMTKCVLNVDNFDFDVNMQVLNQYDVPDKSLCPLYIPDMSEGKEGMKIPIINPFDDIQPPKLEYSAVRIPMNGVHINTDPEFMACCDCTDDCADKSKCSCFQMTIQGYKFAHDEEMADEDISYVWKRLLHQVPTGIYECHSRCKCSSRCLNKVVQQPIQIKMHLFRTTNRGWGLECCHDIPKGTFICIYAGRLYTEDDANALCKGLDHGDEYFAELDLIETATPYKEGYEAGVIHEDSETDEEKASDSDSDYDERKDEDMDFMPKSKTAGSRETVRRSTRGEKRSGKATERKNSNESDSDSDFVNILPTADNPSGAVPKTRSLRKLFGKLLGKNEKPYVMDAKQCGNVGRYFNHSCDPNLYVQSVFVDTHDIRFPWIAFFAAKPIKAGDELTWNYNYEVGSVPSKVLYCKCGAKNCRGRIL